MDLKLVLLISIAYICSSPILGSAAAELSVLTPETLPQIIQSAVADQTGQLLQVASNLNSDVSKIVGAVNNQNNHGLLASASANLDVSASGSGSNSKLLGQSQGQAVENGEVEKSDHDGSSRARAGWGFPVVSSDKKVKIQVKKGSPAEEACKVLCETRGRPYLAFSAADGCICQCPVWEEPCTLDCCTSDSCGAICDGGTCDSSNNCLCPCNLCDDPTPKTCPPGGSGGSDRKRPRGLHSLFYQ